ncbi:hypothetical protein V6N13_122376 [Hibiscus sabdariffa]
MTLEHDEGNGANVFDEGPDENNELNGIDESVNVIVGEDSNNIDEDISGSDWVDGDNILSDDDDDDDELASLKNKFNVVSKKIKNKTITVEDLEPDVALEIIKFSTGLIEEDLGGLGSGEGTEYLDSSDVGSYKTDSDGDVACKKSGKVFFDASAVEPRFQLGMIFESQQQLKDTLCAYAVAHSFDFRYVSNRKEKIRVVCKATGCPFVLHASWDNSDGCFKIKTLVTQHQCSVTYKNKRANFKLVGKHFLPKIRILPNLKVFDVKRLAREELKVDLHKRTCLKARKWALEKIRGNVVHEFNRLFDYVFALRSADPNGTFDLMVERPTDVATPKFRRLYVCFSALKEGFKRFCRPIISLDGCYLKGEIKGEILSAVGRDGNNQIFPIAWALVEVENRETWAWFLENIQRDLNLGDGSKFTLISDMQKGLIEEVQLCLPNVEHRFCARHMYANWKKSHKGGDLQLLFWSCCKATTQPQFEQYASRIFQLKKKAFDDLMEKDPRHWSKAFFSTRSKCDAVDNNYSEAFNSAILGARFKSVISMFEDIRYYVMGRLVEHKKKSISWKGELCPRIEKKLEVHKISSAFCHVIWNGAEGYEVMCHQDTFVVDITGWSCTCRLWDLTGIPCPHVVCVVLYRDERLEDYVLVSYKKHVYIDLYNAAMPTISSEQFWKDTKMGSLDPPLKRKLPGRPKHKRKREEGEVRSGNKWTKRGVKMTCRLCGLNGHNIRTCPNKKQDNVQTEDVQTKSAQSVQSESSSPIPTSAPLTEPQIVGQARTKITSNRTPGMCRAFRYNLHTRAHRYASTTFQPTTSSQQHVVVSEPPTTFSQQHTTVSELHAARAPKLIIRRP